MAQFGSASALGAEGRRFKSSYPDMAYILSLVMLIAFASCSVAFYLYARNTKVKIMQKDSKISELEMAIGYAEAGLDMCNKKIKALTSQIEKLNSDNKLLTAKISKLNNQFKNVKDYLNKN
jgi:peptidoglycan hydrolase CwlO-like protein